MNRILENSKKNIANFLKNKGYNLQKFETVFLLNKDVDPRITNYYKNRSFVIDLPIEFGRGGNFYKLEISSNPFAQALRGDMINKEIVKERLNNFYSTVKPTDALEWLNLDTKDAPELEGVLPWSVPLPWSYMTLFQKRKSVIKSSIKDNSKFSKGCNIFQGHAYFGPVSSIKLNIEVERIWNLHLSIKREGFIINKKFDGQIGADVLVNELGEWRYIISPGQHRVSVLSALRYKKIPIRIKNIIYRNEVLCWPNVRSNLYTPQGALKVFDEVFNGRSISIL